MLDFPINWMYVGREKLHGRAQDSRPEQIILQKFCNMKKKVLKCTHWEASQTLVLFNPT